MKTMNLLILQFLLVTGCSTLKKSMIYGGLGGAAVGAVAGINLSPDEYSKTANGMIWGGVGALIGAGMGYIFFSDDPENMDLPTMILPEEKRKSVDDVAYPQIIPSSVKAYKVEAGPLPDHLKGKAPNPLLIEHTIPERTEKLNGGRTITIDEHKAWEVTYE